MFGVKAISFHTGQEILVAFLAIEQLVQSPAKPTRRRRTDADRLADMQEELAILKAAWPAEPPEASSTRSRH